MEAENKEEQQARERIFWRVEYIKRKALTEVDCFKANVIESISCIMGCNALTELDLLEGLDPILLTYFARYKEGKEKPWFDLSTLSDVQLSSVAYLNDLSIRYGHFAYVLIELLDPDLILKWHLANEEAFPFYPTQSRCGLPPYPRKYPRPPASNKNHLVKTIKRDFYTQEEDSNFSNLGHEINANILFCINALTDEYDHNEVMKEIERQLISFRTIHKNIREDIPLGDDELSRIYAMDKKDWIAQYRIASYHARAVGLWLWDYADINKTGKREAINEFRKRGLDKGIAKYNESGETRLGNYYNNTCKCIKEGEVLPIG